MLKRKMLIAFIVIVAICSVLVLAVSMSPTKDVSEISIETPKKPVVLIIVDSLMSEPLQQAVEAGKAPALSFLLNNGTFHPEVISSYPTMSVTIDSTLVTGSYADHHKIPGLIWYKEDVNRIVSYGSGFREIWNNGVGNVVLDAVVRLNEAHLSKDAATIHEELAERGLQSASINGLVYRGSVRQELHVPKLLSLAKLLPKDIEVEGPALLSLGALSQYNADNDHYKFIWKRMGVNDDFTANELIYLIKQGKLPSFTLAYLPDADASIHKNGPGDTKGIEKADQALQQVLNSYPSWEEAVQETTWIVMGDSGQSIVEDDKEAALIDLNSLLEGYTFWEGGKPDAQLAIAINERMAYIYINDEQIQVPDIVDLLKKDERIGFIAWSDRKTNHVVGAKDDEGMTFSPDGPYVDGYGRSWRLGGNVSILDIKANGQDVIGYDDYPDALARLHGALHSQNGKVIIVDARPSYEFIEEHSHDHAGGGAHGSLHKVDSLVPLIVAGADEPGAPERLVDVKAWILQLLGGPQ